MNRVLLIMFFVCCGLVSKSQTATFIILDNTKNLYKVTIGSSGCTSTFLSFCTNFTGTPLSIALDGNILYVADNKGFLYKNTLGVNGTMGNCTKLGSFPITAGIYGLTVGNGGIVYAATGSTILTYNPATNAFTTLGAMPSQWTIGGDLIFYKGKLYEAIKDGTTGNNALIEINLTNVANSSLYMNFNAGTSVFGFASVIVPCQNNQSYALSSNGNTTDIFAVDMTNKTQASNIFCTLNYNVYDAASIAETQSATPPVTVPLSYSSCTQVTYLGNVYTSSTNVKDTIKSVQGCDSIYHDVTISINKPTSSTTTISTNTSYVWNGTTYNQSGTYTKTGLTNSVGCDSTATLVLTIGNTNPCWKSISAGLGHTIAIKTDSTLWAWGSNSVGQLGDGTFIDKSKPTQIGINNNWASVSAGNDYAVAIKTDGTLWAWGYNNYGQLGNGTNIDTNIPIQIGTDNNWLSIDAGGYHAVAIKVDGSLWAWGNNFNGQLGDGTNIDKNKPIQIGIANNWLNVSAGAAHTLAIKTDSTLWAWGNNHIGQLGDATNINKNIPIQIGTNNWLSVVTGYYHTLALKTDGSLWAWGQNYNGELGDGTKIDKNIPTSISIANNWRSISAGDFHTLALKTDGSLWAWGENIFGQLGSGDTVSKNIPTSIGIVNWTYISAGGFHTIAIKANGSLWSWGENSSTQLGDGTNVSKNNPTLIIDGCIPCPVATTNTQTLTSCKAIVYNGSTYNTSTILRDTVKNFQDCDSVYNIVNININPVITKANNTALSGCNAITYLGHIYTSSAIVRDTVRSFYGCDSIYNNTAINITHINPVIIADTINGCDTVFYNGFIYTSSAILQSTIKSYQGCDSIYSIHNINVYPSPKIVGGNNVNVLSNASVVLHPIVSNASSFNWTPAIYLNDATVENPVCTPKKDTTYKIVVSNANGCKDSSYIKVTVIKQLDIPNVFSPNGDGINDTWMIDGLQAYNQSTVQVFNRWGQKLFSSFAGNYKPWNGMYKGNPLPLGTYYYIIKLSQDAPVISGVITILK